jgi:U3 small nucleolar RNA-associated protein 21
VLGYDNGMIAKFNMQSGTDKGIFKSEEGNGMRNLHSLEVTGLGIDSQNKFLVSGSLDKTVKLWDFYRAKLIKTYTCDFPISNLVYNRFNNLIAFSTSDLSITLLNAKTGLQKVRQFNSAANNKITDICFS